VIQIIACTSLIGMIPADRTEKHDAKVAKGRKVEKKERVRNSPTDLLCPNRVYFVPFLPFPTFASSPFAPSCPSETPRAKAPDLR
jgi:hypothetical protein